MVAAEVRSGEQVELAFLDAVLRCQGRMDGRRGQSTLCRHFAIPHRATWPPADAARRRNRATFIASAVALLGIGLTVNGAVAEEGHLLGDLLALGMTVLASATLVIIRTNRTIPMLPAAAISALSSAALVFPLAAPWQAGGTDLFCLFMFGTTQFGEGLLLITLGTRLVSATRSALWGSAEIPIACVWVWLAFGEIPSAMACLGGLVVMAAVSADTLFGRPEQ
jgi:drug/metabolite transporter (DMT)-like permease